MSTNPYWIAIGCALFAAFIIMFAISVHSSGYEEEETEEFEYQEDSDANS